MKLVVVAVGHAGTPMGEVCLLGGGADEVGEMVEDIEVGRVDGGGGGRGGGVVACEAEEGLVVAFVHLLLSRGGSVIL